MRGLGAFLPASAHLVDDPFGLRFAGSLRAIRERPRLARASSRLWLRGGLQRFVVYMQLRTRVIDDDVSNFSRAGGRQLVLLGAGFDCRAWRLDALGPATVFEVDHPATQEKKRAIMAGEQTTAAQVTFVPWDFDDEPLDRLPSRLGLDGHDPRALTMTVLEGVLMYLTEEIAAETFDCVARYSAPGSPIAFTYFDRALVEGQSRDVVRLRRMLRVLGEPFRFGIDPAALPAWLDRRGFRLERDESASDLANRLGNPGAVDVLYGVRPGQRRFALARRASSRSPQ